jgi:transposase
MMQTTFPDSFIPPGLKKFETLQDSGSRLVYINGVQVYCLELADEVSCRHAAVQLYLCWKISQREIASVWNVTIRTINSWVKNYRTHGVDGLKNQVQGPPVKISPEIRKKVIWKRQENWKVSELCQHFSLSKSAVYRIFEEDKKDSEELLIDSEGGSESMDRESIIDSLVSQEVVEKLEVLEESRQIDPMDRSADRFYAQLGLLDDAAPVFAQNNHVEWAGAFLAVAMLSKSNFFECISKTFITIGPAFFGLRNVFMSFF